MSQVPQTLGLLEITKELSGVVLLSMTSCPASDTLGRLVILPDCREMLKDIDRVVHDDDDAGSAEAHDRVAGTARFTLKKDGAEFEDEEYCTPYAGPQSVESQALHFPRVRGCFWM